MTAVATPQLTPAAHESRPARTVSMHVVRVLIDVAVRASVARERLLRALGLDEAELATRERVSEEEAVRMTETVLALSEEPAFGLRWAESLSVDTFSPSTYLITNAATLGDGLDSLLKYSKLLSDEPHIAVQYHAHEVRLLSQPMRGVSVAFQRLTAELSVIAFIRIVRTFCPTFRPERVCLAFAAPSYHEEYARIFECVPAFEQPFTGLAFDRALLSSKAPYRDQTVHDALRALAEQRMATGDQSLYYAARVRELLVQRGRVGGPAMIDVAKQLGLSVHALRRRLTAEATTFAALEHEAFATLVKRRLIDEQRTIQEAAFELGFSGTASFHRAFKRALGVTPLAYLHAQLAGNRS